MTYYYITPVGRIESDYSLKAEDNSDAVRVDETRFTLSKFVDIAWQTGRITSSEYSVGKIECSVSLNDYLIPAMQSKRFKGLYYIRVEKGYRYTGNSNGERILQ